MKRLCAVLFAGLTVVVLAGALDLTGKWELEANFDDSSIPGGGFDCAFKQDGEHLTGNCSGGTAPVTGELKGQSVRLTMKAGRTAETITYTGTVNEAGTRMQGRFVIGGKGGSFTALKQ